MLDILGSVFGRSKKANNGSTSGAKDEDFVNLPETGLYPTIMLTDQMLKGADPNFAASPPSSLPSANTSAALPSSIQNPAQNSGVIEAPQSSIVPSASIQSIIDHRRHYSPLDNVLFTLLSDNSQSTAAGVPDFQDCFSKIASIGTNLERPQYLYSFRVERTVMNYS